MPIHEDPHGNGFAVMFDLAAFDAARVLEIGCGDGRLTREYAERAAHVTALDPKAERIAAARRLLPDALLATVRLLATDIGGYTHPPGQTRFDIALFGWSL